MNGLNFFIKFDEIRLSNKVGEGGNNQKLKNEDFYNQWSKLKPPGQT